MFNFRVSSAIPWLFAAAALFLALGLTTAIVHHTRGNDFQFGLRPLFDLDRENSIPTWFNAQLHLACAITLGLLARGRSNSGNWTVLALVFVFFSIDEVASIHELLAVPASRIFGEATALRFRWVLLGAPLALLFGLAQLRFLFRLPAETRNGILFAGMTFCAGALGVEAASDPSSPIQYSFAVFAEEGLEMLGLISFLRTLWLYIERTESDVRLEFRN